MLQRYYEENYKSMSAARDYRAAVAWLLTFIMYEQIMPQLLEVER